MCITSFMNNMTDRNKVIIKHDMLFCCVFTWVCVKGQGQFTSYVIRLILDINDWDKEPITTNNLSKNSFIFNRFYKWMTFTYKVFLAAILLQLSGK